VCAILDFQVFVVNVDFIEINVMSMALLRLIIRSVIENIPKRARRHSA